MSSSQQAWEFSSAIPLVARETANWYAVQTRARHEKVIAGRLQEQGLETFLPVTTEVHRWSDRRKKVEVPLFGCYVFVKLAPSNEQRYRVCNLDGVFGFVGIRGQGIAIPEEQIEAVRALLAGQALWSSHPFLHIGQRVRIRGGSLDGVEGILSGRNGERTLIVSVDAIQRSLAVRIEGYDVEPVH